jgi:hypothetical protein
MPFVAFGALLFMGAVSLVWSRTMARRGGTYGGRTTHVLPTP